MQPVEFKCSLDIVRVLEKAEEEEVKWIVEGFAATSDLDLQGDIIAEEAITASAKDLLENSTVLFNHKDDQPIGKVVESRASSDGLFLKVLISQTVPEIWKKIKEGVLNKFSIRGRILNYKKRWVDELRQFVKVILKMVLTEASLVSVPANPKARAIRWYLEKALDEFEESGGETPKIGGGEERMEEGVTTGIEEELKFKFLAERFGQVADLIKGMLPDKDAERNWIRRKIQEIAEGGMGKELLPSPYPYEASKSWEDVLKQAKDKFEEIAYIVDKLMPGEKDGKHKLALQQIKATAMRAMGVEYPYPSPYPYPKSKTDVWEMELDTYLAQLQVEQERKEQKGGEREMRSELGLKLCYGIDKILEEIEGDRKSFLSKAREVALSLAEVQSPEYEDEKIKQWEKDFELPEEKIFEKEVPEIEKQDKEKFQQIAYLVDKLIPDETDTKRKTVLQQIKAIALRAAGVEYPYPSPYPYPRAKAEQWDEEFGESGIVKAGRKISTKRLEKLEEMLKELAALVEELKGAKIEKSDTGQEKMQKLTELIEKLMEGEQDEGKRTILEQLKGLLTVKEEGKLDVNQIVSRITGKLDESLEEKLHPITSRLENVEKKAGIKKSLSGQESGTGNEEKGWGGFLTGVYHGLRSRPSE